MKKKVVSVLLCLSMFTAMAAGCGSSSEGTSNATASGDKKETAGTETTASS